MRERRLIRAVALAVGMGIAVPPASALELDAITALAEGALVGENVDEALSGFDIRILKDGQPVYHQAFGGWSIDRVASTDSSIKNVSAVVIMSVAETGEGGFSLDSHLADFLPEYDKPGYQDITIRQAFSHTSGFGSIEFMGILEDETISLREAATLLGDRPLVNGPPGSKFAYGGLSMHAAGAAVEVATGERFVDLLATRILEPLGMSDTQFTTPNQDHPRIAGAAESTASDFSRFMDMVLNDGVDRITGTRVLASASITEMNTRQTTESMPVGFTPSGNSRYGIGVWLDQLEQAGPPVDVMAGGAGGFHSWIDSEHGLVFTFSTDSSSFPNVELLSSMMHAAIIEALPLAGDFNSDGKVDAADYSVWRDTLGAMGADLAADGDGSGMVDSADYDIWRTNYGNTATAQMFSQATVPEPSTLVGIVLAGFMLGCMSRCETSRAIAQ